MHLMRVFCPVCGGPDCGYGVNGKHGSGVTAKDAEMKAEIERLKQRLSCVSEELCPNGKPSQKLMRLGESFESAMIRLAAERDALRVDLAAARAALKVEQEACDEWRQCVCGHESGMGHVVVSRALKYASNHDARRAAEANGGGNG